jgi:Tfp pilus assembly protein PilX
MRLIKRLGARLRREQGGYAMIAVVGATAVVTTLVAAALAATNGDLHLTKRDLDDKRAYAAAQAGIADYSFHLNNDNSYWARCTNVPTPNAVNQQDSTANRRYVPGSTDASYAIQLLPATGQSSCNASSPVTSMLEAGGPNTGSFRVRSTGYVDGATASIVATFKRASLLDYVYFTQLETSDPVTYGFANPSAALTGAYSQCTKFRRDGRESASIPNSGGVGCSRIVFVSGDDIKGPLHTNDDLAICGNPSFGRTAADVIEVSAPPTGWISGGCSSPSGANPQFVGPFVTTAPVLTPPATNGKLKTIAGPTYTRSCQTNITLSGNNMTVSVGTGGSSTFAVPTDGVFYVANGNSSCSPNACSTSYSPFNVTYPSASQCGNVNVHGSYSGQLTIAAENDIIVDGNLTRSGSTGLLGLIANNFVRIKHPFANQTTRGNCNGGSNGSGSLTNPRVDAAILAIQHSFIVDHYDCGSSLGTLQVNGAISQKFRGAVGTTGGTGYIKDYNYDDRLRYQEPPNFLDPVESAWHIQRETLDFP